MPQDIVKMCYQAAFGAEHLLSDITAAKRYFDAEFDSVEAKDDGMLEFLSDDVCRIDLGAWKSTGMPKEWLFNIFVCSATVSRGGENFLEKYLDSASEAVGNGEFCFSLSQWRDFIDKYRAAGCPAIHHSPEYREKERPAYRIADRSFLNCLDILKELKRLDISDKNYSGVISIDGRAASGKTTLANKLSSIIGAEIVSMDDFFLPPPLRTSARLSEAGGNIHYERFCDEVLPSIRKRAAFSYGRFDCGVMRICGDRMVGDSVWRIVEGSYSHHPKFKKYTDIRVFCNVEPIEQMRRIYLRDGEMLAERFKNEWIPIEEKYFSEFNIKESADIVICQ